ncbi:MAG: hypothetical protein RLZZ08_2120 [Pseudomonadota bacterium]
MHKRSSFAVRTAFALSLGFAMAGCVGTTPNNSSLNSVHEPVVDRSNFTLDIAAGSGGIPVPEKARLADWFETLGLGYGDRVAIDAGYISDTVHDDVAALAGRYGLLLSEGAPVTEGYVAPGKVRVVVTRSSAHVENCPDWGKPFSITLENTTHDNFGCAVNGNVAAMIADPEHLLHGATGNGETTVMSASKAIKVYRENPPTGKNGLPVVSSQGK